jgi:organic hydroperoxide reductase OsmC/OhrA
LGRRLSTGGKLIALARLTHPLSNLRFTRACFVFTIEALKFTGDAAMSVHEASINWQHNSHETEANTYSRNHLVTLNGGQEVNVSASVEFKGDPNCADPEQMLVSAVSSCHMLFFLAIAELKGYQVESYQDDPKGYLESNEKKGKEITRIELSPRITFGGDKLPDQKVISGIHANAHSNCFIRNSITAEVTINHL